jgi:hypothetical protein
MALKKPYEEEGNNKFSLYIKTKEFLVDKLKNDMIYTSTHQLGEIFHVLSFRGSKLPLIFTRDYIKNLIKLDNVIIIHNEISHLKDAIKYSSESGIHVWDFLCILPLLDYVETIYSCDHHFFSEYFQHFNIIIENPIDFWLKF